MVLPWADAAVSSAVAPAAGAAVGGAAEQAARLRMVRVKINTCMIFFHLLFFEPISF